MQSRAWDSIISRTVAELTSSGKIFPTLPQEGVHAFIEIHNIYSGVYFALSTLPTIFSEKVVSSDFFLEYLKE